MVGGTEQLALHGFDRRAVGFGESRVSIRPVVEQSPPPHGANHIPCRRQRRDHDRRTQAERETRRAHLHPQQHRIEPTKPWRAVKGQRQRTHHVELRQIRYGPAHEHGHAAQLAQNSAGDVGGPAEVRPGNGIRSPMLLTTNTHRYRATHFINWTSECARLWYHQSWAEKQR